MSIYRTFLSGMANMDLSSNWGHENPFTIILRKTRSPQAKSDGTPDEMYFSLTKLIYHI